MSFFKVNSKFNKKERYIEKVEINIYIMLINGYNVYLCDIT